MSLEWKTVTLGSCCNFQEGYVNPSQKNPEYFNGDIKWIRAVDLNDSYVYETSRTLTREGYNSAGKSALLFKPNTIVISKSGTVGRLGIIKDYMCGNRATINIIPHNNISMKFIFYVLKYHQRHFKDMAVGSVQKNLYVSILENLEIPLPSIEVQNKIATVLSNIDDKIDCMNKINKNLEEQIETIYNSFFVYYDDYSQEELEECEIGIIPKEWKLLSLGEVTTQIKEKVGDKDYKVFSAVNTGNLILSEEYFDKQVFSKSIEKYIVVKQKEFAYNPARINIGSIGRNDFDYDGCVSPVYVAFKVEEEYENFMNMFIQSDRFKQWVITLASGSVRQTLNYADFSIIKLAYPPIDLIKKFNNIYDNYYEVINYNKSVIHNLEKIRDILLPKLMSGEIDVSKVNCDLIIVNNHLSNSIFSTTSAPLSVNLYSLPFLTSGLIHSTSSCAFSSDNTFEI
nr:restriction endonuclease subunit S [uncultured Methanobrevibacter sp.]